MRGVYFGKNVSANNDGTEVLQIFDISENGMFILDSLIFGTNSSDLNYATNQLMLVIDLLKFNPDMRIELRGHTDDFGSEANNQKVSEQRSRGVKDFLVKHHISGERITVSGKGQNAPLVPNTSPANQARNRRVEIIII